MRTVGVEEEFLLVDSRTGTPRAAAQALLSRSGSHDEDQVGHPAPDSPASAELQQQQIEVATSPQEDLGSLAVDVHQRRVALDARARTLGVRVAALGTSPVPVAPITTPQARYLRMRREFGLTEREQLSCGCHVHVAVESGEEAAAVLDRIRVWLPVVTALSANSPFWNGVDTDFASYRTQLWGHWPSAGPIEVVGSERGYRQLVQSLLATGVPLDEGMVYFDARISARYPTVEVRVSDVCLYSDDAVLLAGLVRGLVETAARDWRAGVPAPPVPAAVLRAAAWRASRSGLDDQLVHPLSGVPREAATVVADLQAHVADALTAAGDAETVAALLHQVLTRGNGATRQRAVQARTGSFAAVALDAAAATTDASSSANPAAQPDPARSALD